MRKTTTKVPECNTNTENNFPKTHKTKLDTSNPIHLTYRYEALSFEVLGGVNTESYQMLRVMLFVKHDRKVVRDNVDLYNNYNLTTFIRKVVDQTGFGVKYVEEAFNALTEELEAYRVELSEQSRPSTTRTHQLTPQEQQQAETFLKHSDLLEKTNELIGTTGVLGNDKNRLISFLINLSRKQDTPLHAVIQSEYNYLQTRMGELIPNEDKIVISHLSDNCLFYFAEYELNGKVLLVEDTGTNKSKLLPLLDLQRNGYISKTTIEKDELGKLRTVQRYVRGSICLSLSTPNEHLFTSNAVLSFVLSEEKNQHQDDRIMQYQRKQSAGLVNRLEEQKAVKLIQNVQRALQPLKVVNPFAEHIQLPAEMLHKQITNAHYLRFIEVVTLFYQYQREQKTDKITGEMFIETTVADIQQANELLTDILLKKCDNLNAPTRIYLERLKTYLQTRTSAETTFTNTELSQALNIAISTVKRYHSTLLSSGHIRPSGKGDKATGYHYELVNVDEYIKLETSVTDALTRTLTSIQHQQTGSPVTKIAQSENEPLKPVLCVDVEEVAQNSEGVHVHEATKKNRKALTTNPLNQAS